MEGTVRIKGLKATCRLGTTSDERSHSQPVEFDIAYRYDVGQAVTTDAIDDAVDYSAVSRGVVSMVAQGDYDLLETLCAAVARFVLDGWSAVSSVDVVARKFPLPRVDSVEVFLTMDRS